LRYSGGGTPRSGVFLDRDGTINVKPAEGDYIRSPEELQLLPGAGAAIRLFNDLNLLVVVVTNQRAVALGIMTMDDLAAVTNRLNSMLAAHAAHIDASYACIHDEGRCDCRKPAPGLILRALVELPPIDLASSMMIGDTESDVFAGRAAGLRTLRLAPIGTQTAAEFLCRDLAEASRLVLAELRPPSNPPRT
jgi:D-glycero-D-manno-heptose 1,7-bisphosphate phosphatase